MQTEISETSNGDLQHPVTQGLLAIASALYVRKMDMKLGQGNVRFEQHKNGESKQHTTQNLGFTMWLQDKTTQGLSTRSHCIVL